MKLKCILLFVGLLAGQGLVAQSSPDWANLSRFKEENLQLGRPSRN